MSTVLTVAGSPGRMPLAVRMAAPLLEFTIDREPVENVFDGFADDAVKFAPDPTATAVAQSRAASAPRRRLGLRESLSIVVAFLGVRRRVAAELSSRRPSYLEVPAITPRPLALRPRLTTGLPCSAPNCSRSYRVPPAWGTPRLDECSTGYSRQAARRARAREAEAPGWLLVQPRREAEQAEGAAQALGVGC